jgi:hypothetical protein
MNGSQVLLLALDVQPAIDTASVDQIIAGYGGSWRGHFVERASGIHPASERTITIHNRCSRMGPDASCDQAIDDKPAGTVRYHPQAPGLFEITNFAADGIGHPGGTLQIAGNVWTYPWTETRDGKPAMLRITNRFENPDKIIYEKSISIDGGKTWLAIGTGSEERIAAAELPGQ